MSSVEGIDPLKRRLKAMEKAPDYYLEEWQMKTIASAKTRMRERRPGTGVTAASIQEGYRNDSGAEVTAGGAAPFLEYGTRPHTAPFDAIKKWAARKGNPGMAGGVWAAIRRRGTRPYPFLRPAAEDALKDGPWKDVVINLWNKAA